MTSTTTLSTMTQQQIDALHKWLQSQAYSGEYGTGGDYLRLEELERYLPAALAQILATPQN